MNTLALLREQIDQLNAQLLKLLNQRALVAKEIGLLKKNEGLPVYVPEREQAILATALRHNHGPLSNAQIERIMAAIMEECRALQ